MLKIPAFGNTQTVVGNHIADTMQIRADIIKIITGGHSPPMQQNDDLFCQALNNYKICIMKKLLTAFLILTAFCFAKCEKDKPDFNGLPAATQQGKNTLGFMLNSQPWTPQGFNGTANLSIDFDPGFNNGVVGIAAYRITTSNNREYFGLGIKDSLNFLTPPFTINLSNQSLYKLRFENNNCSLFSSDSDTQANGQLTITKLDRTNRIISGTFNATLSKAGCSTIQITDGRFDMKF